jgi:hypothetical protein
MTIYLPDDLAAQVKEHPDLNASAVCQDALRHELARRAEVAKLTKGMERIVVQLESGEAAFTGTSLPSDHSDMAVYLTKRQRIAVYDEDRQDLGQYDTFDEFAEAFDGLPELVADVAAAVGENYVIELDI